MKFICIFLFIALNSTQDLIIHENELTTKMEEFAIGEALVLLSRTDSAQLVAKNLVKQMNNEFGKHWICFVGKNFRDTDFGVDHQNNSTIWFSFKDDHIVLFKPQFNAAEVVNIF